LLISVFFLAFLKVQLELMAFFLNFLLLNSIGGLFLCFIINGDFFFRFVHMFVFFDLILLSLPYMALYGLSSKFMLFRQKSESAHTVIGT